MAVRDDLPWDVWTRIIQRDAAGRGVTPLLAGVSASVESRSSSGHPASDSLRLAVEDLLQADRLAIATGFVILSADPPAAETDGPPGALAIARMFHRLGRHVSLLTDEFGARLLRVGCRFWDLPEDLIEVCPIPADPGDRSADEWLDAWRTKNASTHLLAIERVGPSHTSESLTAQAESAGLTPDERRALIEQHARAIPDSDHGGCYNMRGRRLDTVSAPLYRLFEDALTLRRQSPSAPLIRTIGVGDGGNEIGMGSLPWLTFHAGLPGGLGGKIACRTSVDRLIVAGVSNWGGYALALGLAAASDRLDLFDRHSSDAEQSLIVSLITDGGAVDGFSGLRENKVDGLSLVDAVAPLGEMRHVLGLPR